MVFFSEKLSKYIKCDIKSYIIHFFYVFAPKSDFRAIRSGAKYKIMCLPFFPKLGGVTAVDLLIVSVCVVLRGFQSLMSAVGGS